jgi:hypothetical protein
MASHTPPETSESSETKLVKSLPPLYLRAMAAKRGDGSSSIAVAATRQLQRVSLHDGGTRSCWLRLHRPSTNRDGKNCLGFL